MNKKNLSAIFVALFSFFLLTGFFGEEPTPEEARKELTDMRTATLNDLYQIAPSSKKAIQNSAGYAVFSNVGINLFLLSTANGAGVAHNNKTGKDIFMNMWSGGVGVGLGVKDFRGVFIFTTAEAYNTFVTEGWQAGAQADAAAKSGEKGDAIVGAIDVGPGTKLYQLTETGLAIQATIQGTKYWKDEELNKKILRLGFRVLAFKKPEQASFVCIEFFLPRTDLSDKPLDRNIQNQVCHQNVLCLHQDLFCNIPSPHQLKHIQTYRTQ